MQQQTLFGEPFCLSSSRRAAQRTDCSTASSKEPMAMSWKDIFGRKAETKTSPSTTGQNTSSSPLPSLNTSPDTGNTLGSPSKEQNSTTNLRGATQSNAPQSNAESAKAGSSGKNTKEKNMSASDPIASISSNARQGLAAGSSIETVELRTMHHRGANSAEIEAAESILPKVSGLRYKVLGILACYRDDGATGEMVAEECGDWLYSVKPRITELTRLGLVQDTGRRLKNSRNRKEVVWAITEKGKEILNAKDNA